MQRKTKSAIVIIAVLVIFGGIFGYIKFTEQIEKPAPEKEKERATVEVAGVPLEDKIVTKEELLYPDNLVESKVNEVIHSMSHQKVKAASQWGREQITQAKVDRLLEISKKSNYKYKELYIEILERWSKGDFSHAVDDHNKIWKMQGGDDATNSGRATRLLSPEEEEQYIEQFFGNEK
ncbi:hypothetical protein AMS59_21980 [Lysinibacillus sp. FJAT-14745]|uniref:DUF6241 domain-containing protein n=1 Tax=Lysinibacillus sp. FJAT-14745 TaxID=1704289 RepID=UPI0006ABE73C|nr:DUF6241 domain-containing protein [Lysinibacillus sp. FJAT-14745]KOP69969.1 hypothetical protein AMS59_21980 [Lysinibacillus sp. FJAT-14745]